MVLPRRGESLIEILVALVLLAAAASAAASVAVTTSRLTRHADRISAAVLDRWTRYRAAETAPSCADSAAGRVLALDFAATPDLAALSTAVRCGR